MKSGASYIQIKVQAIGVDQAVSDMLKLQSPEVRRLAIKEGADDAQVVIQDYYQKLGRNLWVNPSLPTHGPGRKPTQWWRGAERWLVGRITGTSAIIENKTIGLSHKITGGTIRAKRKKFLTIPVDPRAHGLTARQFSRTISPLFVIKGALMMKEPDGDIKAIYALKKQVTQKPWKNALPPEQSYTTAFMTGVVDSMIRSIE